MNPPPRLAVFTLLFNPSYLPGATVLALSVRHQIQSRQWTHPPTLGVLVDTLKFLPHQLDVLHALFDEVITIDSIVLTQTDKLWGDLGRPELAATFSKVWLWQLTQYDKVLYLDADTLPLNSGDALVVDLLTKVDVPPHSIAAAPDSGFPDVFNSGVLLLTPNLHDFSGLVAATKIPDLLFDGADQGLLNQYFNPQPDWVTESKDSRWVRLPFVYNCTPLAQYQYSPAVKYVSQPEVPDLAGAAIPDHQGNVDESLVDQLANYHQAALSYIRHNLGIKLMHFIGPNKPWYHKDAAVYAPWWQAWQLAFGNLSIHDLSRDHITPQVVDRVGEIATKSFDHDQPNDETKSFDTHHDHPESSHNDHLLNYQELLVNPHLYDAFGSAPEKLAHGWDAAREAPPPEPKNTQTKDFTLLEHGMRLFQNEWDRNPAIDQVEEDYAELDAQRPPPPPQFEPYKESNAPPLSRALEYHYVAPERVFEGDDYFPVHRLPKPKPVRKPQVEEVVADDEQSDEALEEIAEENLLDLDLEEEVTVQEDIVEIETETLEPQRAKLFPWEYKSDVEGVVAERVFD